jgi:hypothetical protein
MAHAKGMALLDVRLFVERQGGAGSWDRLKALLSPDDAAQLDAVVAVGWYDVHLYVRIICALGPVLGRSTFDAARELGHFAAKHDLAVIHRLFLRLANPAYVLEKAGEFWGRFYDSGKWTVTRETDTRAKGELSGFAVADRVYCEFLRSYLIELFELVGARAVRFAHPQCRALGARSCVFSGEWR